MIRIEINNILQPLLRRGLRLNLPAVQSNSFVLLSRRKNEKLQAKFTDFKVIRSKYDKSGNSSSHEEHSDGEDDDIDEIDKKTTVKINVQSLRADLLLKSAIGMARNKIEAAFYENKIRLNGKKLLKKSVSLSVGDELDLIKNESPVNPNHLVVARIEILSTVPKGDNISVTMRRFKSLTVEKYEN